MNIEAAVRPMPNYTPWRWILPGGFAAGLMDFLYASIQSVRHGGAFMGPWKGVAGALVGSAAKEGGMGYSLLGAALHFFILVVGAILLYFLVRAARWLPRQWVVLGALYGIAVMLAMNYVIVPLSRIGHPIYALDNMHVTALLHIVLVGLPTAWFVARALRSPAPG
jgi:hypothetical protein